MSKAKIILIAGHGGSDPGAVAHGVREADLTAGQRELVTDALVARGYTVASPDDALNLNGKIAFAKGQSDAALLVDLHFNAATPAAYGTETYVRGNASHSKSHFEIVLAENLSRGIAALLGTHDRGAKPESWSQHSRLGILHTGPYPSVLIETCFITNKPDLDSYLANTKAVAERIAEVIDQSLPHA